MKYFKSLQPSALIKSAGIYTFFNIVDKSIPFLIIPIITRLLPLEDVGYYTLYQAIFNILVPILTLSIDSSILLNYFKLDTEEFKRYFSNGIFLFLIVFITLLLLTWILSNPLSILLEFPSIWLNVTALVVFFQFFNTLRKNLWQVKKQAFNYGVFSVILTLFKNLSGLAIIYYFDFGWQGIIIGHFLGGSILFCYSILSFLKEDLIKFKLIFSYFNDLLSVGGPLSMHNIGAWLSNSMNRVLISSMIGKESVGSYGIGAVFGTMLTVILVAFNNAYVPYLFEKLKNNSEKDKYQIVKMTYIFYFSVILASAIISIGGYYFVEEIFGTSYQNTRAYILPITLAAALNGMYKMHVNYLFYMKRTLEITKITFTSGFINIVLAYLMIDKWGVIGAAYSVLLIQFLTYILTFFRSNSFYPMPWKSVLFKYRKIK